MKNKTVKKWLRRWPLLLLLIAVIVWFWPIQITYDVDKIDHIEFWNGNIGRVITVSDPDEIEEFLSMFDGLYFRRQFKFDRPGMDDSGGNTGKVFMKDGTSGKTLDFWNNKSVRYGFFYYAPYAGELDVSAFYRLYGQEPPY